MAIPNFIEIQKYLQGLDYPATKEEIIMHVREQGADEEMISALDRLPEKEYEGPPSISTAVNELQE